MVGVGAGRYLIAADQVVEIEDDRRDGIDRVVWRGMAVPTVDLRALFGETDGDYGACVLCAQTAGQPAALIVDRVAGFVAFDDGELCALPPIGRFGGLIDAVAIRPEDAMPMLRLCAEHAGALAAPG